MGSGLTVSHCRFFFCCDYRRSFCVVLCCFYVVDRFFVRIFLATERDAVVIFYFLKGLHLRTGKFPSAHFKFGAETRETQISPRNTHLVCAVLASPSLSQASLLPLKTSLLPYKSRCRHSSHAVAIRTTALDDGSQAEFWFFFFFSYLLYFDRFFCNA